MRMKGNGVETRLESGWCLASGRCVFAGGADFGILRSAGDASGDGLNHYNIATNDERTIDGLHHGSEIEVGSLPQN